MSRPEFLTVPDRTRYYDQAESWAGETTRLQRASRRLGWIAAGAAGTIALLEAAAIVLLVPMKTTVPYVVTVDRQTGYVELAQGLKAGGTLTQQEAVIQSALVQYVLARETFDAADLAAQYARVQLWSDPAVARSYVRWMGRANPESPVNQFPASTVRKVTVKGVTMIDKATAVVRFDAVRIDPAATTAAAQSFSATVRFRFSGEPMKMEDRFVNPLGFQVTSYRRDAETTGPAVVAAPPVFGGAQ